MTIEPMRPADLDEVHDLLRASHLPTAGLDAHVATALVARDNARVVGSAALELYLPFALLRSAAVAGAWRGQGVGQLLTSAAIALARRHGVQSIYLLTETAEGFFAKLGFVAVSRTQVPPDVQQSVEFTTLCPQSARAMTYRVS